MGEPIVQDKFPEVSMLSAIFFTAGTASLCALGVVGMLYLAGVHARLDTPTGFVALSCVVVGTLGFIYSLIILSTAWAKKIMKKIEQGESVSKLSRFGPTAPIAFLFVLVISVQAMPYVLRSMYGVPFWGYGTVEKEISVSNNPNYSGCYLSFVRNGVRCVGTGHDELLQNLMSISKR